jgi:hypothetical protein
MNDLLAGGWWQRGQPWQSWATLIVLTIGYVLRYPNRAAHSFYFALVTLIVVRHYEFSIYEQCTLIFAVFYGVSCFTYPINEKDAKERYLHWSSPPDDARAIAKSMDYSDPPVEPEPAPASAPTPAPAPALEPKPASSPSERPRFALTLFLIIAGGVLIFAAIRSQTP